MVSGGVAGFVKGLFYTRERLHDSLGGSRREVLPTGAGEVVCACLTRRMNPRAPEETVIGCKERAVVDEPGALLALVAEGAPADASLVLLLRLAAAAANGRCLNSEIIVHLARSANAPVSGAARTGWGGPASDGAVRRERA